MFILFIILHRRNSASAKLMHLQIAPSCTIARFGVMYIRLQHFSFNLGSLPRRLREHFSECALENAVAFSRLPCRLCLQVYPADGLVQTLSSKCTCVQPVSSRRASNLAWLYCLFNRMCGVPRQIEDHRVVFWQVRVCSVCVK